MTCCQRAAPLPNFEFVSSIPVDLQSLNQRVAPARSMVASKGRGAGGIRILDEFRALKDDVKKHGSESGKDGSTASAAKFSRKSGVHNASFRPFLQTNQIDEGKVHGRRKALADIGNINNQRSQQFASRVNKGSKLTCTMETFEGSKKVNLNGSNCLSKRKISIARNSNVRRLSITKSIVISDVTSTKNLRRILSSYAFGAFKSLFATPSSSFVVFILAFTSGNDSIPIFIKTTSFSKTWICFSASFRSLLSGKNSNLAILNLSSCSQPSVMGKLLTPGFNTNCYLGSKLSFEVDTTISIIGSFEDRGASLSCKGLAGVFVLEIASCSFLSAPSEVEFFDCTPRLKQCVAKEFVVKFPVQLPRICTTMFYGLKVSSKLQRASLGTQNIDIKKLTIAKFSEIKDLKKPGRSNRHDNTFISQELCCDCHSNNSSDEVVKKTISSKKNTRRKSYTSSLLIRNCDDFVKNDMLPYTDDFRNPLEVVEYVEEIYRYYWTMEVTSSYLKSFYSSAKYNCNVHWFIVAVTNALAAGRPHLANYMEMQSEISPKMRDILVNWLIEVHHKYQLMEESLFLMVELLDRLLSVVNVQKKELQLYGLTCLLLASKYEDHWHPKVVELLSLSVDQYTRNEILAMEWFVLKKLQFHLNVPTPYVFMLRFLKAAEPDKKLEDLAFYLVELCIGENEYLKYKPSLFCASAIFVARCSLKLIPFWTGLLSKLTHYEETPAEMILRFHKAASCKPIKYTYQKFLKSDRNCVASVKPISRLPP
ncbi:Putative cyclin-B3-1 [Apostasia shenzhenica]|uniref:Cyclin-B3-1 n=1 Tax=Apostasia shenzhenica TaxID=1088818 RepID=A0A2H9ZQP4_9ASPA|nr:Putative cyclin-B3-1 [Apostasia shenzhenica]